VSLPRRLIRGGTGFAPPGPPEPDPVTVTFAWVGAVTSSGATVKARSADATAMTLRYSLNSDLSNYLTAVGTEGNDEVWTFVVSGLSANTLYYYGFAGSDLEGQVRTFPSGESSFVIAAGSCAGQTNQAQYVTGAARTSDSPAFARILDRDPALFIHLGDLHYKDINTNNVASFRSAYRDVLANDRQHDLYRQVPFAYIWDDHDFGANDSNGSSASKPAAQTAYRDYVPHYTVPAAAIYQTFVIGRVRVILLDVRSERTANTATDNSAKTMLGATQKAWFKSTLSAATEPVILVAMGSSWNATLPDSWGSFSTERQELAEYFEDNDLTDRIILLHGDIHGVLGDDGENTQWDPGSSNDGPMLLGFAPLDGNSTTYTGTYQEGPTLTTRQQYGTLSFVDAGATITVTANAWASSGTSSESEVFEVVKVFAG
jgi:phosphodiesterase/alkaline phosphatase D-like protein